MKIAPLISVVIPCFNDGIYLPETIQKIKEQTLKDFEIIVVNDGSTDSYTLEILEKISQQGITILHKQNGKMSSARNHGVRFSNAHYIVTVDSDDYFDSTFFEKAISILNKQAHVAVVSSHIKMFGAYKMKSKPRGGGAFNFLFSNECSSSAMIRKSCWEEIDGYDEQMTLGYEDWEFYIRITQKGWKIEIIPEFLTYYRQTEKSMRRSKTEPNKEKIIKYILNKHKDWFIDCLSKLIIEKQVIYTERRTSYSTIFKLLSDRLTKKYK